MTQVDSRKNLWKPFLLPVLILPVNDTDNKIQYKKKSKSELPVPLAEKLDSSYNLNKEGDKNNNIGT